MVTRGVSCVIVWVDVLQQQCDPPDQWAVLPLRAQQGIPWWSDSGISLQVGFSNHYDQSGRSEVCDLGVYDDRYHVCKQGIVWTAV